MRGWVPVREPDEIERAVATIAGRSGGGLIVTASGLAILHRGGRNLLHIVTKRDKLTSNIVCRHSCFDANEAGWQVREPRCDASARDLLSSTMAPHESRPIM
jgi:hypothetical protein